MMEVSKGQKNQTYEYKVEHQVLSLMYPHPLKRQDTLEIKQVKLVLLYGLKTLDGIAVGDTMTDAKIPTAEAIDGFEPAKPFICWNLSNRNW